MYDATRLHEAVCAVSARCDGAFSEDGIGFNGHDTLFGKRVAREFTAKDYDDDLAGEVYRMLRTYKAQLQNYGVPYESIPVPPVLYEASSVTARDKARQAEKKSKYKVNVSMSGANVVFSGSTYDIRETLKGAGASWDGYTKTWRGPLSLSVLAGLLATNAWAVTPEVEALLEGVTPTVVEGPKSEKVASVIPGTTKAIVAWRNVPRADFNDILQAIKDLPSNTREYKTVEKVWICEVTEELVNLLRFYQFEGIQEVTDTLIKSAAIRELAKQREILAHAASSAEDTSAYVALDDVLYPFQKAGVEYGMKFANKKWMIGDQMGLGKTYQGLSALETANAYPAVIVCPASLKLNWQKEAEKLLPHRTIEVVSGKKPHSVKADITIINYDIMETWAPSLCPLGLVLDESQYIKNYKAKRTIALLKLSERIRAVHSSPLILLLSGTPFVNRPVEGVTQLEMIDAMKLFGNRGKFLRRYCYVDDGGQYANYNGAHHLLELNDIMRSNCYVRREKADVLKDLPNKLIATQWVEMPKAIRDEYNLVKSDLVRFLVEMKAKTTEEARRALRAEVLVKINSLRHLCGQAKVDQSIEWITEFLASTSRSLVVFATHVDVQNALYERLSALGVPTARIQGGAKDDITQAEKERFQSGQAKVIVCSLKAGGVGHTLTAASDVLMVEQGWTPADHNQALDRVHRIGQTQQVTGHFLLVDNSIDQWIFNLIQNKQRVVTAVTSGIEVETEEDLFNLLVRMFLE